VALVARNSGRTDQTVTETDDIPVWSGSVKVDKAVGVPGSVASPINLSADSNWKKSRYQLYETVIPIRNIPWMGLCS
jgi:hypothetical protein